VPNDSAAVIAKGQAKATEILARRKIARAKRAEVLASHPHKFDFNLQFLFHGETSESTLLQTAGFLAAAGDSWFDYPFFDVLKLLEDEHGYNVESSAHRGDPLEAMAYQGGQLDKFARSLEKITAHGTAPKAVLLSGGGDDIAGKEFGMLLNNATSNIEGWNAEIVDGLLNQRVMTAFKSMLASITHICQADLGKTIPILIHGYDYPVPDGRGFWGGWPLPGPWLEPGFREKLFADLPTNIRLMHDIIDRFNKMLQDLVQETPFSNVHYVDLRGTLSTDLTNDNYKTWWDNELHPTETGFSKVAARFALELSKL